MKLAYALAYAVAVPALAAIVRGITGLLDAADRDATRFANDDTDEGES